MPRIPPWLFRRANRRSPNIAALLPACRNLQSAVNELRWLKEHVNGITRTDKEGLLSRLCRKRGHGYPLQYILGTQPFGPLDIKCRPGVLIPRPETEAYTYHLADLIKAGSLGVGASDQGLGIVDFCTGTGCIPLLLYALLYRQFEGLEVLGVDISTQAVSLARNNIAHNARLGHLPDMRPNHTVDILQGDIFQDQTLEKLQERTWDVMVSNPPYISRRAWRHGGGQIGHSVRKYEPSLALVPGDGIPIPADWEHEDIFYARLLDIAYRLKPKAMLLEIGDEMQAARVIARFSQHRLSVGSHMEIWRDWPDMTPDHDEGFLLDTTTADGCSQTVVAKGSGNVRSILLTLGSS
ncbi:S-adenosyl-L-methionine-dependent methyltransferase [Trichoderma longibrachiatum]|uniref:S-adenosyl-L-methionine-dependent methyltransferase n=1 Tax=Trichoderma longibrachiatum ATCC 18648 TaxID=983965 RepID=A0A2T4BYW7_TRILO|nr:S-adenosyl-L-methionine-dependent methyltransferase [Trichoderma longibrachiatum ATCC 18648]